MTASIRIELNDGEKKIAWFAPISKPLAQDTEALIGFVNQRATQLFAQAVRDHRTDQKKGKTYRAARRKKR